MILNNTFHARRELVYCWADGRTWRRVPRRMAWRLSPLDAMKLICQLCLASDSHLAMQDKDD